MEASSEQAREELVRGFPPLELATEPAVVLFAGEEGKLLLVRGGEPVEVRLPLARGEGLVRYRLARIQGRALVIQGFSSDLSPSLWWMRADDYLGGGPPSRLFYLRGGLYLPQGVDHPVRLEPYLGREELSFYLEELGRLGEWERPPVVPLAQIKGGRVWSGYLSLSIPGLEPEADLLHPTYLGLEGQVKGLIWYPLPRTSISELDLTGFGRIWVEPLPGSELKLDRGLVLSSSRSEAVARVMPLVRAGSWLVLLHQTFDGGELVTFHHLSSADPNGAGRFEFEFPSSLLSHPLTGHPSLSHRIYRLVVLPAEALGGGSSTKEGDLVLLTLLTPVRQRSGETTPPELLVALLPAHGGRVEVARQRLPTKATPLLLEPKDPLAPSAQLLLIGWDGERLAAEELSLRVGVEGFPKGLKLSLGPAVPLPDFRLMGSGAGDLARELGGGGREEILNASLGRLASLGDGPLGLEPLNPLAEGHQLISLPLLRRLIELEGLGKETTLGELLPWLGEKEKSVLTLLERRYYLPRGGSGRLLVAEPPAKPSMLIPGQNFLLLDHEGKVVAGDPTRPELPQFYSTYPLVLTTRGRAIWIDGEGRVKEIEVERYQPQHLIEFEQEPGTAD